MSCSAVHISILSCFLHYLGCDQTEAWVVCQVSSSMTGSFVPLAMYYTSYWRADHRGRGEGIYKLSPKHQRRQLKITLIFQGWWRYMSNTFWWNSSRSQQRRCFLLISLRDIDSPDCALWTEVNTSLHRRPQQLFCWGCGPKMGEVGGCLVMLLQSWRWT